MKDFYKYIETDHSDANWGLYLTAAGRKEIPDNSEYPLPEHGYLNGHNFIWSKGRILSEFQIYYITDGNGFYENKSGTFKVRPGTVMIIHPGEWHRFRPLKKTGWTENYICFKGEIANNIFSSSWFTKEEPVVYCNMREEIIDSFYKIFHLVQEENSCFQFIASGMIIKLMGYIVSFKSQNDLKDKKMNNIIEETRFLLREHVEENINLKELAIENNMAYSYFRKMFKKYTGFSPKQYFLHLKIDRAQELLISTDMTIKEIGYRLGFQSIYHFSRIFKEKTGKNPSELRKIKVI